MEWPYANDFCPPSLVFNVILLSPQLTHLNYRSFSSAQNFFSTKIMNVIAQPLLLFGDIDQTAGGSCQAGSPNCQCSWTYPGETSCSYHIEGTGLISLVHDAGKEIYPSIGGWTLRYDAVLGVLHMLCALHFSILTTVVSSLSSILPILFLSHTLLVVPSLPCRLIPRAGKSLQRIAGEK